MSNMFKAPIPYCFKSNSEAVAAEAAVNARFENIKAYATERMLYVPEHKSLLFRLGIEEFIRSLGGKLYSD